MPFLTNPFPNDPDRGPIGTMLVERDIDAFITQDWADNPDSWRIAFPDLDSYRDEWLSQAAESAKVEYAENQHTGTRKA